MKTKTASRGRTKRPAGPEAPAMTPTSLEAIAVAAYYRAERRGFAPGGELADWLEAERELGVGSRRS